MLRAFFALLIAFAATALAANSRAAELPFVNWEDHPIHALDLSPNGKLLAVAHTADQRVQLFDVSTGEPLAVGSVVVGIDPVSVRFRNDNELWVVNHISDSVSVVDIARRQVKATLATADEPFDAVFAGTRAFVSCAQAKRVLVFQTADLAQAPQSVAILADDPRAMAVSADGRSVYVAMFTSGNGTTLLAGGLRVNAGALPNAVSDPRGPYGGLNPPPNSGTSFDPPINPASTPPAVGLIVRKRADNRWLDDNNHDWTSFVSGSLSTSFGRASGWDLPDRDLAIIDSESLAVRYVSGLMNIGMAMAVNPASGEVDIVGTEAINEVRFEPKVNSQFVRVHLARVNPTSSGKTIVDLNPQLDYQQRSVTQTVRDRAVGDPRALVWRADGQRGWVAGLGSNNVIPINADGSRAGNPINVGEGPVGLALDEGRKRLYVWNHFAASLSVIDTTSSAETKRVAVFNPLPEAIRAGRPLLYDTHRTSGLGQASCGSCHVDARMDKLAWDLGDPAGAVAHFDQNCVTTLGVTPCQDFQAMKGPMTTQTLQDIVGHEPFHWRGDRAGLEAFNPAFQSLLGDDARLTTGEMQLFENFLATITFPPNPFRNIDNTLPTQLPLEGQYTSGRFSLPGQPLGTGDAVRGLQLYSRGLLDSPLQCASCHTLPTGMAVNGQMFLGTVPFSIGGIFMPIGPLGENHLGIVSVDGSTNVSIKVPQLRNQYQKVGFNMGRTDSQSGFGFLHDGSVDTLPRFISARAFSVQSDQDVADIVALMLAFSGSDYGPIANPILGGEAPLSRDSHAAVGTQQSYIGGTVPARIDQMLTLARTKAVDLVVHAGDAGYAFDAASDRLLSADNSAPLTAAGLEALANSDRPQTWSVVPVGLGRRLGIDRDGDGVGDALEIRQGSNPADANSTALRPAAGLWYNPQRSGHGFDLQLSGQYMVVTWYTYNDDGSPTWYQASAPFANSWVGVLNRFTWNPATGYVNIEAVGDLHLTFSTARNASFTWRLGARSGTESVQTLIATPAVALPDRTGIWYDPHEPGWGLSVYSEAQVRYGILFFYDGDNQPRWVLGQGVNTANETLPMLSFHGFCPDCAVITPTSSSAGQLVLSFDGTRVATVTTDAFYASQPNAPWRRGPVAIQPLSDAAFHPEQF